MADERNDQASPPSVPAGPSPENGGAPGPPPRGDAPTEPEVPLELVDGPALLDPDVLTVYPAEPEPEPAPVSSRSPRPAARPRPLFEKGSLRLFSLFGIDVFVHWSWLLLIYFEFWWRPRQVPGARGWHEYDWRGWYLIEFLSLFGLVLLHEFGHALACRSVGGRADRLYLWFLGGIAFVNPPPRPGAVLWSIAAGPLVNLLLIPVTGVLAVAAVAGHLAQTWPDLHWYLVMVAAMNFGLFAFNMLPIYPLDGGQILHALLWFLLGRGWSLLVAALLGLPVSLVLLAVGLTGHLGGVVAACLGGFGVLMCLAGLARARLLMGIADAPRREEFRCPACGTAPPVGTHWMCSRCAHRYDPFAHNAICPRCGNHPARTLCVECFQSRPFAEWAADRETLPAPPAPAPPARPAAAAPVSAGERVLWAALFGSTLLVGGWLAGGRTNLVPVAILAAGGALLGASEGEVLSRGRRVRSPEKSLRGTWRLVDLDGRDLTRDGSPPVRLTITGYFFTERTGGKVTARGSLWMDATREPALINIVPREGPGIGTTFLGVYEIEGDEWRVSIGPPGGDRPTEVRFDPGRQQLLIYRRE